MKIDPYNNKEKYLAWKSMAEKEIEGISKNNANILLQYLNDMEIGINVSRGTKKGARSFISLISSKDRLLSIMRKIKDIYKLDKLTDINEEQILLLFANMSNGKLTKPNGKKYVCVRDFVKVFKAFWHWYQRISKKNNIEIQDITSDLDTREEKPDWVYLTEEQIKRLADNAKYEYKILIWFLFDTGMRAPTELMNIKVSDFFNDFKELNIREEIVKGGSFGRRIKLLLSQSLIKEYVKNKSLKNIDFLFEIKPTSVNKYLKRLAKRLFGDEKSPAGQKYSDLTMYDFRHCSCCYWLPRYKSEPALKYRFGWKSSDKIHYYSELLGMKDTISEEDMLIDVTKTEIEKRLAKAEKENELLKDEMSETKGQIKTIFDLVEKLEIMFKKYEAMQIERREKDEFSFIINK